MHDLKQRFSACIPSGGDFLYRSQAGSSEKSERRVSPADRKLCTDGNEIVKNREEEERPARKKDETRKADMLPKYNGFFGYKKGKTGKNIQILTDNEKCTHLVNK